MQRARLTNLAYLVMTAALLTGCGAVPPTATGSYPTADLISAIPTVPALHAALPADVRLGGVVTLGTIPTPGTRGLPHSGKAPDGTDIGVDVDLRNAVAKVLGVRWSVGVGTFATIIPGVQNGKYTVGQADFGVTKAREKVVDFATYLTDGQAFLGGARTRVEPVRTLTDLCGLIVAATPGSTFQQILDRGATECASAGRPPYTVQYFTDTGPILLGLTNGKVDVYFGPTLSVTYDATRVPGTHFLGQISSTPVGFVTAKGSPLAKPISDAVNELIRSGAYARILGKWNVSDSGIPASAVNPPARL